MYYLLSNKTKEVIKQMLLTKQTKQVSFTVSKGSSINLQRVAKQIETHNTNVVPQIKKMQSYYDGDHSIYHAGNRNDWMIDTHVAANFCKQITTTRNGYFAGLPVSVSSIDDKFAEAIAAIDNDNDAHAKLMAHAQAVSIASMSYELLYIWINPRTGQSEVRYMPIDPTQMFVVYDDDIEPDIAYAVRYYTVYDDLSDKHTTHVTIYTPTDIQSYVAYDGETIRLKESAEPIPHYFDETPIVVYKNVDNQSDYEQIIPLQDAYNTLISNEITDIELLHDALLIFKDLDVDSNLLIDILQNRIIQTQSGRDKEGEINWLSKPNDITRIMTMLDAIKGRIHEVSMTPDMTDDQFGGNLSGVAIRFKLTNLEAVVSRLEANFRQALYRRYYLIANYLAKFGHNYDYKTLKFKFTRNLPINDVEEIDKIIKLNGSGLASQRTLMAQVPFIDSVQDELDLIEQEQAQNMSAPAMTALLQQYTQSAEQSN